ncbi:hypothetical protein [Pseudarthrobacter sulfonivorans]|uniref:hypothetical protein n=1 Tax=Pseudarthrobacter sulfonivorans TaxID=121292 RepID=UPI00285B081F|nr:hypothetical protein [Pseudarthrobacter sulfonivorans]MDR6413980.1 hypothetical protein [Pseudarthrobacter sulfonivorans]
MATSWGLRTAALLLAGALATGCSAPGGGGPAMTAQPGTSTGTGPGPSSPEDTAQSSDPAATPVNPAASSSAAPSQAATAAAWKTFADPARTVSFDLPEEWIAQSVTPDEGTFQGALKIEVKKQDGTFVAALRTGLPPSESVCPDAGKKPYIVISSVPVDLPGATGENIIAPHAVFRVIQGYRYFGSYGITNIVGGVDGKACELRNVVRGPAGKGDYSFGDVGVIKAFAPDEKVAPAKAFDTLGQAAKYVDESSDFANVQRMLMSLEIKN